MEDKFGTSEIKSLDAAIQMAREDAERQWKKFEAARRRIGTLLRKRDELLADRKEIRP